MTELAESGKNCSLWQRIHSGAAGERPWCHHCQNLALLPSLLSSHLPSAVVFLLFGSKATIHGALAGNCGWEQKDKPVLKGRPLSSTFSSPQQPLSMMMELLLLDQIPKKPQNIQAQN